MTDSTEDSVVLIPGTQALPGPLDHHDQLAQRHDDKAAILELGLL